MTYGVAMRLERGLVFAADTRTNAGVDNIAQYRKLQFWRQPGDRVLVLLSAGNLAVTQAVLSLLNEQLTAEMPAPGAPDVTHLFNAPNMFRAARVVGDAIREARRVDGPALEASKSGFNASFIFGGQIGTERPRLRCVVIVPRAKPPMCRREFSPMNTRTRPRRVALSISGETRRTLP